MMIIGTLAGAILGTAVLLIIVRRQVLLPLSAAKLEAEAKAGTGVVQTFFELVQKWMAELPPGGGGNRIAQGPFLQQIDGLIFGENPRHGFFRDGVFYHPELRFQFTVPRGWQAQNLTDAVIAVSPDRDAALQLTTAEQWALKREPDAVMLKLQRRLKEQFDPAGVFSINRLSPIL